MMKILKTLAVAACMSLSTAAAGFAATMDFQFSFTGATTDGSPFVVGIVRGLKEGDNAINTVEIISNSLGYGIGTYTHNQDQLGTANWTVTGGTVTSWTFLSFGLFSSAPDVTDSSLVLSDQTTGGFNISGLTNLNVFADTNGSAVATFEQISQVPLPATGAMLAVGLLTMGAAGKRRKAKA